MEWCCCCAKARKRLQDDLLLEVVPFSRGVRREQKGSWLSEHDELAAFCFGCGMKFSMGKRHHCRRCGNTFCADCSTNRAPERVCDDCYPTALKEYDFLTRQIPEHLDAGEVVARRISGTILFGKKTETVLVRLNVAGDGLEISNTTIRLASIVEVEDPLTIKTDQSAVRLEGATPQFVEAVKAAVYFSKAPDLALAVDQQRQAIKLKKQREEAVRRREAALAQRRADNANLRNNLKQKYSLK